MVKAKWVSKELPSRVQVLLIDDDKTSLKMLKASLEHCGYNVTAVEHPITALRLLKERRTAYDLVISDVFMPDLDGFELAEYVRRNLDVPVVLVSGSSADREDVVKGVMSGARDFLVKPVQIDDLKHLCQHILRHKKFVFKKRGQGGDIGHIANKTIQGKRITKDTQEMAILRCANEEQERDDENNDSSNEDCTLPERKKRRFLWTIELKKKFIHAVDQIGFAKASPKRIMDIMNVPGLSRLHISSHLQKYRLYMRGRTEEAERKQHYSAGCEHDDLFRIPCSTHPSMPHRQDDWGSAACPYAAPSSNASGHSIHLNNGIDGSALAISREQILPFFQSSSMGAPAWRSVVQNLQGASVMESIPDASPSMDHIPHIPQALYCNDNATLAHASNQHLVNGPQISSRNETVDTPAISFSGLDEIFVNTSEVAEAEPRHEDNLDPLELGTRFMDQAPQISPQEPYVPIFSSAETFMPSDPLGQMQNTKGGGDNLYVFPDWIDSWSP